MGAIDVVNRLFRDLGHMLYPPLCEVCDRPLVDGEKIMCLHCNTGLPRTRYHTSEFNGLHTRLVSEARIDRAAAWFFYHRTSEYTRLVRCAKYAGRPVLARELGAMYACEIKPDGFFDGIDIILPVPMARIKELKRGYNQAFELARGIEKVTGIPVGDHLVAVKEHATQTRRNAFDRYLNVRGLFAVSHPEEIDGLHLLVVDDVITTGSTMLAACDTIREACPAARISILSLAAARLS